MVIYVLIPFLVIIFNSIYVIRKFAIARTQFILAKNVTNEAILIKSNEKFSIILLLIKNGVFICCLIPIAFLNAAGYSSENLVFTTCAYILAYTNYS